jgi:cellulose biosynthesis protein BcsQ
MNYDVVRRLSDNEMWRDAQMPRTVFATPKGGADKSTSAVLLAIELVNRSGAVAVIDADPNKPVSL